MIECKELGVAEDEMILFSTLSANKSATPIFNALAILSRLDNCGLPFNVRLKDSGLTFIIAAKSFICKPFSLHISFTLLASSLLIISDFDANIRN